MEKLKMQKRLRQIRLWLYRLPWGWVYGVPRKNSVWGGGKAHFTEVGQEDPF